MQNLPVINGQDDSCRSPTLPTRESQVETSPKHDFLSKLMQSSVIDRLKDYVKWQAEIRQSPNPESCYPKMPHAPISINLDPTSACNYDCDHCCDHCIINIGQSYDFGKLKQSLENMWQKGLKSVILIGGGEPTLYTHFEELVDFIKKKEMQVAVVTNGSGMRKIESVADLFGVNDYVRLSLDSGTEATFQAMHKPKGTMGSIQYERKKEPITLEKICEHVADVRGRHPNLNVGFSYVITWNGAYANRQSIVPNIDEIVPATMLARDHNFTYISFKPFLTRTTDGNGAEVVGIPNGTDASGQIVYTIRERVDQAKKLETGNFRVLESPNLRVLLNGTAGDYMNQPANCHMSNFRVVLAIPGIVICPAYRKEERTRVGDRDAYLSGENMLALSHRLAERIRNFNASTECREVTCLYNPTNRFIENLIQEEIASPGSIDKLQPIEGRGEYFL